MSLIDRYPLRGMKGPVGTSQDMLDLLGGDEGKLEELERRIAEHLGFTHLLVSTGQVYPRSLDLDVVTALNRTGGPVHAGYLDPAHGRARAGDRGLPTRAGGAPVPCHTR